MKKTGWGGWVLLFLGAGPAWADKMVPMPIPAWPPAVAASSQPKAAIAASVPWPEHLRFVQELAASSDGEQVLAEMLTPQGDVGLPTVADRRGLTRTTQDLLRALQVTVQEKNITRSHLNQVFALYNEVIVRLGLTAPSQLATFPKLQAVGQHLQRLREANVDVP